MGYGEKAAELFLQGYNCSQAVVLAFADKLDLDETVLKKIASPFGAGMGGLREVCGAVTGMYLVLGYLYGYDDPLDRAAKKDLYEKVQLLAKRYEEENGSVICREILGLTEKRTSPEPSERTPEYYRKRPCAAKVASAAGILEEYLREAKEQA